MASKAPIFLLVNLLFFTLLGASHSCGNCGSANTPTPGTGNGGGSGNSAKAPTPGTGNGGDGNSANAPTPGTGNGGGGNSANAPTPGIGNGGGGHNSANAPTPGTGNGGGNSANAPTPGIGNGGGGGNSANAPTPGTGNGGNNGGNNGGGGGGSPMCTRDALKLGVCADALGGVVGVIIGSPPTLPCCSLIAGLTDLEAAVCFCTAIRANVLGINLNVPISLSLLLNVCGRTAPADYRCS